MGDFGVKPKIPGEQPTLTSTELSHQTTEKPGSLITERTVGITAEVLAKDSYLPKLELEKWAFAYGPSKEPVNTDRPAHSEKTEENTQPKVEGSLNFKSKNEIGKAVTGIVAQEVFNEDQILQATLQKTPPLESPAIQQNAQPVKSAKPIPKPIPAAMYSPPTMPTVYNESGDGWFSKVTTKLSELIMKVIPSPELKAGKEIVAFSEAPSPLPPQGGLDKAKCKTPQDLLTQLNSGKKGYLDELFAVTGQFHQAHVNDPKMATTLHLLEEKVAEQLIGAGRMKEAFALRSLATQIPIDAHLSGNLSEKVAGPPKVPSGTHFSHLDSGVVKGGNVQGVTRKTNGQITQTFNFKISHPSRTKLSTTLANIKANQGTFQASLPENFGKVSFATQKYYFKGKNRDNNFTDGNGINPRGAKADVVSFEGKGKVIIGASPEYACLHNQIIVEMDPRVPPEERAATMQAMLSVLGLGPVLGEQRPEDMERMKVAQLFRAYHPNKAFQMERSAWFYEIPVDRLKRHMESEASDMKGRWGELKTMTEEPIYPGKMVWCVPSVAADMKKKGAMGLMAGVGGSFTGKPNQSIGKSANSVCLILKNGALSSQDRFLAGLFKKGASSVADLAFGGGDCAFTRCVTQKMEQNRKGKFPFQGNIQILYDLEVVNRGAYGYSFDKFGTRKGSDYAYRQNLPLMAGNLTPWNTGNEVMVKNRIDPNYIKGLVVQSEKDKKVLVAKLRANGLVTKQGSKEYVNGKPIDEFVHVADKFTSKMWQ